MTNRLPTSVLAQVAHQLRLDSPDDYNAGRGLKRVEQSWISSCRLVCKAWNLAMAPVHLYTVVVNQVGDRDAASVLKQTIAYLESANKGSLVNSLIIAFPTDQPALLGDLKRLWRLVSESLEVLLLFGGTCCNYVPEELGALLPRLNQLMFDEAPRATDHLLLYTLGVPLLQRLEQFGVPGCLRLDGQAVYELDGALTVEGAMAVAGTANKSPIYDVKIVISHDSKFDSEGLHSLLEVHPAMEALEIEEARLNVTKPLYIVPYVQIRSSTLERLVLRGPVANHTFFSDLRSLKSLRRLKVDRCPTLGGFKQWDDFLKIGGNIPGVEATINVKGEKGFPKGKREKLEDRGRRNWAWDIHFVDEMGEETDDEENAPS